MEPATLAFFFRNKAEQSATVAAWTEYTFYKLQQVYTRILYEAGFIKKGKDKLEIIRPIMDKDVADHLKLIGDGRYVDILQGV
ncbi:BrxA family protein [Sporomusa carbonis]|uniref:BrxA family protein n=1 Tax=Sporomusa carbonis TaxID=3076075 RepID=UPI003C7E1BF4